MLDTRVTLGLERLAWGGDAIAHLEDGRIVFVDGGFPGQTVDARITEDRKRFCRARVETVPAYTEHPGDACPSAASCGGCRFQGVDYAQEIAWKVDALRDTLHRIGRDVAWPDIHVVPDESPLHYRARVRLRLGPDGQTGYRARGTHDVVPAPRCDVLHPAIEAWRPYVGRLAMDLPAVHSLRMEWDPSRDAVVVELPCEPDTWTTIRDTVRERLHTIPPQDVRWNDRAIALELTLRDRGRWEAIRGEGVVVRPSGHAMVRQQSGQFSQANGRMNLRLRNRVCAWVREAANGEQGVQRVIDLFCGAGNFAFALAAAGARVVAIDHAADAIDAAQQANPKGAGRVPVWVATDLMVGPFVPIEAHFGQSDVIVLDPPRGGLSDALRGQIAESSAHTMVYVSCDPPAFARDIQDLRTNGWRVEALEAWDMFPRTAHLEVLAKLVRSR